jgi:acylphosphatase
VRVRARAVFRGRVQGVFFRDNTRRKATELCVVGWVRNRGDGAVEAVFEGEKAAVQEAIRWCSHDQPHATVDGAEVEWMEPEGDFSDFSVRR